MMEIIYSIMCIFSISSVNSYVLNYDYEDRILDILLSDNYIPYKNNESEEVQRDRHDKLVQVNKVWLCGDCSDISEINLLYNESYNLESTYDKQMQLQIGFSVENMRCIKIDADENAQVKSVRGACASDAVTLEVINTSNCDISIYS